MKNLLTILPTTLFIAFLIGSCQDQNKDSIPENLGEKQAITVTLGAQTTKTGRYAGSYDEVNRLNLTYQRHDKKDELKVTELTQIVNNSGSSVRNWSGALDSVISGVYYDFKATAYMEEQRCSIQKFLEFYKINSLGNEAYCNDYGCDYWIDGDNFLHSWSYMATEYQDNFSRDIYNDYAWYSATGYDRESLCSSIRNLPPVDENKKIIFEGETLNYQLLAGSNNLKMKMVPKLKPQAENLSIPTITKVRREKLQITNLPCGDSVRDEDNNTKYCNYVPSGSTFSSYQGGDLLGFLVETNAQTGSLLSLTGTVVGNCEFTEQQAGNCTPVDFSQTEEYFLCEGEDSSDVWGERIYPGWDNRAKDSQGNIVNPCPTNVKNKKTEIAFPLQLDQTPPDELVVTFTISQQDINQWDADSETSGGIGLSNSITFKVNRNSFEQASQMIFMPTIQNIAFTYDMSSPGADMSYKLDVTDLSSEIEIYATLKYSQATPLGTPTPYMNIEFTGSGDQTLFGQIDKNEDYLANLKLTFVHRPTLYSYTSEYQIISKDKAKFGDDPYGNWQEIMTSGICHHCNLYGFDLYGRSNWQYNSETGEWEPTIHSWNNSDEAAHRLTFQGASLDYANMGSSTYQDVDFYNSSFLGTNLAGVNFRYSYLDSSKFLNSKIFNTQFEFSSLNDVVFSNDLLASTQDQPYTDLKFKNSYGNNIKISQLTTKLNIDGGNFQNAKINENLIYQSTINGLTISGEVKFNDIVETTVSNSDFRNIDFGLSNFVDTDFSISDFRGANLYDTWFDRNSGSSFYLAKCDETTILPKYNNLICHNEELKFVDGLINDAFLTLIDGKDRAAYLYEGDTDSFKLEVIQPKGIGIEVSSKNIGAVFQLFKFSDSGSVAISPVDANVESIARVDGTYNTTWKYFSNLPSLAADEFFFVQVSGIRGVYYVVGYFEEN